MLEKYNTLPNTLGLIKVFIGTAMFYSCVTRVPQNCHELWEMQAYESFGVPFLMLQVAVVWGVFVLIPRAQQKGSYHKLLKEDHQRRDIEMEAGVYVTSTVASRRTRLLPHDEYPKSHLTMRWLMYEVGVFTVCLILGIFSMVLHHNPKARVIGGERDGGMVSNWRFSTTVFWLQTLYGFGSFPFVLLDIPLVSSVFTHARPTGYNRNGDCVPLVGLTPEAAKARREEVSARRAAKLTLRKQEEERATRSAEYEFFNCAE